MSNEQTIQNPLFTHWMQFYPRYVTAATFLSAFCNFNISTKQKIYDSQLLESCFFLLLSPFSAEFNYNLSLEFVTAVFTSDPQIKQDACFYAMT